MELKFGEHLVIGKRIIPKIRTFNSFDFAHDGVEVLLALRPGVSAVKAFAGIDAGLVAVVVANQASDLARLPAYPLPSTADLEPSSFALRTGLAIHSVSSCRGAFRHSASI